MVGKTYKLSGLGRLSKESSAIVWFVEGLGICDRRGEKPHMTVHYGRQRNVREFMIAAEPTATSKEAKERAQQKIDEARRAKLKKIVARHEREKANIKEQKDREWTIIEQGIEEGSIVEVPKEEVKEMLESREPAWDKWTTFNAGVEFTKEQVKDLIDQGVEDPPKTCESEEPKGPTAGDKVRQALKDHDEKRRQ